MAGSDNANGFPHSDVAARYRRLGIPLLRTDHEGSVAVFVSSDGA